MAAVPDAPPAADPQNFSSSPAKVSRNVGTHDQRDVQKLLPEWMCVIKPSSFSDLRDWGEKVIGESNVFTKRLQKTKKVRLIVMYLNNLSQAVRKQDKSKQRVLRPGNRS
jgi:hypothetical protein